MHFCSDKTTVKFAPTAFVNQYEYLDTEETKITVDRYELYMLGKTNPVNPDFKVSILNTMSFTSSIDCYIMCNLTRFNKIAIQGKCPDGK